MKTGFKNGKILSLFAVIMCLLMTVGCHEKAVPADDKNSENEAVTDVKEADKMKETEIIIDWETYVLSFEDNETADCLVSILPLELEMNELNGNEKYVYLDKTLTTDAYNPGQINKGDVMLFGNDCLVIFYKSFNTPYSYTRVGKIENLPDLGNKNVKVTIGR